MKILALQIPDAAGTPIQIQGPAGMPQGGANTLANTVRLGLDLLLLTALILSLLYLIWGGLNWLMSEGEKQRVNQARQKIVYAVLGLLIVFLSFFMINVFYWFFLGNSISPYIYNY